MVFVAMIYSPFSCLYAHYNESCSKLWALILYRLSLFYNPNIYLVNAIFLFISLFDSRMRFRLSDIQSYYLLSSVIVNS